MQTRLKAAAYRLGGVDLEFLFNRKDADHSGVSSSRSRPPNRSINRSLTSFWDAQDLDREEFLSLVRKDLRVPPSVLSDKDVQV